MHSQRLPLSSYSMLLSLAALAVVFPMLGAPASGQTYTTLYTFTGSPDGSIPVWVTPTQGRDGKLYGTTAEGGAYGYGTVFRVSTSGRETVLHSFDNTDGAYPYSSLTLGTDGNFYGTTFLGGTYNFGTVFKITPEGSLTVLHNFTNGSDGSTPANSPIEASDGNLYGVDGLYYPNAVIYKIDRSGTFTVLNQVGGAGLAPLIQAADGNLYGTTYYGGSFNCGSIFQVATSGALKGSYSFPCAPGGSQPYSPLLQVNEVNFYGTTGLGGESNGGAIFEMKQNGAVTILYSFPANGPWYPYGLMQATDGNLYGTTNTGDAGPSVLGTFYQYTLGGTYTQVFEFTLDNGGGDGGSYPPLQHTNGTLYGVTQYDNNNNGTVYSIDMGLGPFVAFVRPTGKVHQAAQILGQGLTGTTNVTFNGVAASSFSVVSDTFMTAVVPSGATTGSVVVTTPGGALTSNVSFRISN